MDSSHPVFAISYLKPFSTEKHQYQPLAVLSLKYRIMGLKCFILIFYLWTGFVSLQWVASPNDHNTVWKTQKEPYFQVIPNPGAGLYTVIYKSEYKGPLTLMVSDATGKYVYLKSIREFSGELKEAIDLNGNPKGLYIFEVEGNYFRDLKKVVLQ